MPGCQTREENAQDAARDHARKVLVQRLSEDLASTLSVSAEQRLSFARDGHPGFGHMEDEELCKAACDANLDFFQEVIEALDVLDPKMKAAG